MSAGDVFTALGGGVAGLLGVALLVVSGMLMHQMHARLADRDRAIAERDERIQEQNRRQAESDARMDALTNAVNRQSDLWLSWMPREQLQAYRQYPRRTLDPPERK